MANKKRIQKLLERKYRTKKSFFPPAWQKRLISIEKYHVQLLGEYKLGYDFALQFENIAKEAEVSAGRFREYVEELKKIPFQNFKLEYLNEPIPTGWLPTASPGWQNQKLYGWVPVASELPKKLKEIDNFGLRAYLEDNKIKGASPEA